MHPLYWIANRARRLFTPDISGKPIIALQPFPSPQRVYTDIRNVIRSGDPCDEKGSVYYLRSDVRYKIGEPVIWPTKDLEKDYYGFPHIAIGGTELVNRKGFMTFQEFITLETLADVIIEIMKAPFKVMLYDLDEDKGGYTSWYKNVKGEIGTEKWALERMKNDKETLNFLRQRYGDYNNLLTNLENHIAGYEHIANLIRQYCTKRLADFDDMKEDTALMVADGKSSAAKRLENYYDVKQKEIAKINEVLKKDQVEQKPKRAPMWWSTTGRRYAK